MKILPVNSTNMQSFIAYCSRYGKEHDESYLPGEDFLPDPNQPAYIMVNDEEAVVGAVSLILSPAFREARKARFRIFHALESTVEAYQKLFTAIEPDLAETDNVYLFIPVEKKSTIGLILENLGFAIQRYSWVLSSPSAKIPDAVFPEGYSLRPLEEGDEQAWCDIINEAFANLAGHLHTTPERLRSLLKTDEHLADGLLLLFHGDEAIGTVRVTHEKDEGEEFGEIGALGLLDKYRGKGLGVNLLRAGVAVGRKHGLEKSVLSVNAENEQAAKIYLKEGFQKELVVVCYNKQL